MNSASAVQVPFDVRLMNLTATVLFTACAILLAAALAGVSSPTPLARRLLRVG